MIAGNADYTALISDRRREALASSLIEARSAGATILTHDPEMAPGRDALDRRMGPTVVLDAPADGRLLTEEIFGPVLPIVGYDTLEEALAFINERPRPLALYAFSDDEGTLKRVLDGAISGGVTLNGTLLHIAQDQLPFGGVGPSGTGAYHGEEGFRRLTHARGVHHVGAINVFERMGPPWGAEWKRASRRLVRAFLRAGLKGPKDPTFPQPLDD